MRLVSDPDFQLYVGDSLDVLRGLPAESVHCCVTSPPYWGLRDYSVAGQLGLEPTPEEYVTRMVEVFREVRRVLRKDGTCWLNIGDSYNSAKGNPGPNSVDPKQRARRGFVQPNAWGITGLKHKDLVGIPWRLAFALQADGWYIRSDIIWSKPNPMPESVTDRPTKAHEYLFLLSKSPRYFYDADAIREPAEWARWGDQTNGKHEGQGSAAGWIGSVSKDELQRRATVKTKKPDGWDTGPGGHGTVHREGREKGAENFAEARGRNKRTVWEIATEPYPDAHFATFPQALVEPCILAGTSERGCCPECGAPWVREVEKPVPPVEVRPGTETPEDENVNRGFRLGGVKRGSGQKTQRWLDENPTKTLGWKPSCECGGTLTEPGEQEHLGAVDSAALATPGSVSVPCVVLDPFLGSGTTALVARRLGRKTIGIELSPEYAKLAAKRLQQLSLLAEPA